LNQSLFIDPISCPGTFSLIPIINRQQHKLTGSPQVASFILFTVCVAVVLVFALLAQYAQPSSDDFCMAAGVNEAGLVGQLWAHYFEWSGRYTANTLYALYPMLFGLFDGYRYIPALVMLALFLAMAFFLSSLFKVRMHARPVLLASLCFVSIFIIGMLSPASSLYWMAGALTYQSANTLILLILAVMIRLADQQQRSEKSSALVAVLLVLIVLAVGTNETSMLAITGITILGFAMHLRSARDVQKPWFLLLIVSLGCFAVVYFSPGNTVRAADFPLKHELMRSLNGSLSGWEKLLFLWLGNPVLIISSLLVPFAVASLFQQSRWRLTGRLAPDSQVPDSQTSGRQPSGCTFTVSKSMVVSLGLCTFTLPLLLQFPAWWSMGGWPPARTVDAIYFLFLVGWFLTICAFTVRSLLNGRYQWLMQPYKPVVAIALVLLAGLFTAAILRSEAYRQARTDLMQNAQPYHEYLKERYRLIERALADGHKRLVVPDYQQAYPRSIYFNDILHNPDDWRNDCYAEYFGLEKIKRSRSGNDGSK
jgi:hypothetical protein